MPRTPTDRERRAVDLSIFFGTWVAGAVRPSLIRRELWTVRPVRRFVGRIAFSTLLGFSLSTAAVHARPKMEALERFERKHGRKPSASEADVIVKHA